MRIGLVVPGGVDRSGRERVIPALLWFVERLAARHEVVVFALGQEEGPGEWPLLGARVVDLGRAVSRALPVTGILTRTRQLARALRRARSLRRPPRLLGEPVRLPRDRGGSARDARRRLPRRGRARGDP